jgi:hypothetical protein
VVTNAPIIRGLLQHGYKQLSNRRLRNSSRDIQSGAEQGSADDNNFTEPTRRAVGAATQKDDRGPLGNVVSNDSLRGQCVCSVHVLIERC